MATLAPIGTNLQNRLNAFSTLSSVTPAAYQAIVSAIQASPALAAELNTAADNNNFAAFGAMGAGTNAGAEFVASNGGTIKLNIDTLGTPNLSQANLVFLLGHETQHSLDAADVATANQTFSNSITALAQNAGPQNYTSILAAMQNANANANANANDEATVQISGWNAYVSYVNNTTPAGVTPNYNTSYLSA